MLKYIVSILDSTNPKNHILQTLVFISVVALGYHLLTNKANRMKPESMQNIADYQSEPFVLKTNDDIYDDYYSAIYDPLTSVIPRSNWEIENIFKIVKPDKKFSTILDVGAGSGYKVHKMRDMGYHAFGVDKSAAMITRSEKFFKDIEVKHGDVMDPMIFERSTFSHIFCTNYTIYEIENKTQFFTNCYNWMTSNGYLILHLVDPQLFNAFIVADREQPIEKSERRITETKIDLQGCQYHAKYDFPIDTKKPEILYSQKFIDDKTKYVRQYEQTLYMNDMKTILKIAKNMGFIIHGQIDMSAYNQDTHSHLFILERTM